MGKCSSVLKTLVPDAVRDEFDALARSLGMDSARLLRMLVLTRVYGADRVRMMAAQEVDMAAGTVPQWDHEGAQS